MMQKPGNTLCLKLNTGRQSCKFACRTKDHSCASSIETRSRVKTRTQEQFSTVPRRAAMKYFVLAVVFCLPLPMIAQQSAPEIQFHAQTDFFKLPNGRVLRGSRRCCGQFERTCLRLLAGRHHGT